ncbi:hypothetical protein G5V59_09710 [Nocardioides sp. W3-2-3]|uniref:hypothetical protein n=1 Tax=Nocardioides convexus TaxID=2712224 RepID=UPI0024182447|nr:hypothetical protein [Nocardioides convexus]NHA00284.1 hypothetical protein [Nocardioides convexus]
MDLPVAGLAVWMIPLNGTAAVPAKISVWPVPYDATPVSGYIRVYPKDQAAPTTSALTFNASMAGFREATAMLVPGHKVSQSTRWVTVENVSTISVSVAIDIHGYFLGPQNYATAGGEPMVGVARTSLGPCYGYLDPANQGITAGCADDYDQAGLETVWSPIGALGEKFRGPVAVASRSGGRFAVAAVHATDGEACGPGSSRTARGLCPTRLPSGPSGGSRATWSPPTCPTASRSASSPTCRAASGRSTSTSRRPSSRTGSRLDIPAADLAPVGDLTAVTTASGIQARRPRRVGRRGHRLVRRGRDQPGLAQPRCGRHGQQGRSRGRAVG